MTIKDLIQNEFKVNSTPISIYSKSKLGDCYLYLNSMHYHTMFSPYLTKTEEWVKVQNTSFGKITTVYELDICHNGYKVLNVKDITIINKGRF